MYFVGKVSAEALAAISGASFIVWALYGYITIFNQGSNSIIAKKIGVFRENEGRLLSFKALISTCFVNIASMIIILIILKPLLSLISLEENIYILTYKYLFIFILFLPINAMNLVGESIYRANNDTSTPLFFIGGSLIINIILDPILIQGWKFIPPMGIVGAAIATVFSQIILFAMIILGLSANKFILISQKIKKYKPDFTMIKDMFVIGGPAASVSILFTSLYLFFVSLANEYGASGVAALGLGQRFEGLNWVFSTGLGFGTATVVSKIIAKNDVKRAKKLINKVLLMISLISSSIFIIFILFNTPIVEFFSKDKEIIEATRSYMLIISVSIPFTAIATVLSYTFGGIGYTLAVGMIGIPLIILRVPLSVIFAKNMNLELNGIWLAISITSVFQGALMVLWYFSGYWEKHIKNRGEK